MSFTKRVTESASPLGLILYLACVLLGLGILSATVAAATIAPNAGDAFFVSPDGTGIECSQANPCEFTTARGQATDGDSMYLSCGRYTSDGGSTVFNINKDLALYGGWDGAASGPIHRDPSTCRTIVDAERKGRVVYISGDYIVTLDGLILTGGYSQAGAGLYMQAPSDAQAPMLKVSNCVITDNVAFGGIGGGIHVSNVRCLIEHSQIISNSAHSNGGGLCISRAHLTLRNSLVRGNYAGHYGDGIYLGNAWARLENVTIVDHWREEEDTGIYFGDDAVLTLTNSIVFSNGCGLRSYYLITPSLAFNNVWGNDAYGVFPCNFNGVVDPTGTSGNISVDPQFASGPEGDHYLSQTAAGQGSDSPCVDSGKGTAAAVGLATRKTRTDGIPDQGTVDMGYHYGSIRRLYLPLVMRGVVHCTNNGDCGAGSYCRKAMGNCGGLGECAVKPIVCSIVPHPACGCDGTSYLNPCAANLAGVNLAHDGACP